MSTTTLPSSASTVTACAPSTMSSARTSLCCSAPLPVMDVSATFFRISSSSRSTSMAMSSTSSRAFSAAMSNPLMMAVGWMSCSSRSSAFFRSSPVMATAVVVPSPASSSWVSATSTIIDAVGLSMSISSRMVTPSLVTVMSPSEETSILSIPFGPSVERTDSATARAAAMLCSCALLSFIRWASSPRIIMGWPCIRCWLIVKREFVCGSI